MWGWEVEIDVEELLAMKLKPTEVPDTIACVALFKNRIQSLQPFSRQFGIQAWSFRPGGRAEGNSNSNWNCSSSSLGGVPNDFHRNMALAWD